MARGEVPQLAISLNLTFTVYPLELVFGLLPLPKRDSLLEMVYFRRK